MKTTALRAVLAAVLFALAALLFITIPARADQPPPPEQPAAPLPPTAGAEPLPAMDQPVPPGVEEPQPLAALEVQPYLGGDPWFKVGSVIHRYMTDCTGQPLPCTQSATPISAALNAIAGGLIPSDRYLYIEYSAVPFPDEDDVYVDGTHPHQLQLKGIRGIPDETTGSFPLLHGNIEVKSMLQGFTLSGIQVAADDSPNAAVYFNFNYGTILLQDVSIVNTHASAARGLYIQDHYGSLEMTSVTVNGNPGSGAEIDTDVQIGVVKIIASTFDDNGYNSPGYGLWLNTDLTVTIDSTSASRNTMYGMKINRDNPTEFPHNLSITNSVFSGNAGGLDDSSLGLFTYGSVKLENLLISDNASDGILIKNRGDVTIRNSLVVNNQGTGISLDTCGSDVTACPFLGTGKVTLQGVNTSANSDFGLSVTAKGAVSIKDLISIGSAVQLHNQNGTGNITLAGILVERAVQRDGLAIVTRGSASLKNISVTGSLAGGGLTVDTRPGVGNISLSASSGFINRFDQNAGTGISLTTNGNITLSNLSANSNGVTSGSGAGAVLTNAAGDSKRKISVSSAQFSGNMGDGLYIASVGAVSLKDLTALDNISSGVDAWLTGDGLQVGNDAAGQPLSVSLTNLNASGNASHGLHVASLGKVTLAASSGRFNDFHGNGTDGANISTVGSVNLKAVRATGNGNGIFVETSVSVVVTNVMADANLGAGLAIQTTTSTGKVTVRQLSARSNIQEGLRVQSDAAVLMDRITALSNGLSLLDEGYSGIDVTAPAQIVTLKSSLVTGNGKHGVHIANTLAPLVQSKNTLLGNNANGGFLDPDLLQE